MQQAQGDAAPPFVSKVSDVQWHAFHSVLWRTHSGPSSQSVIYLDNLPQCQTVTEQILLGHLVSDSSSTTLEMQ